MLQSLPSVPKTAKPRVGFLLKDAFQILESIFSSLSQSRCQLMVWPVLKGPCNFGVLVLL